MKATKYLAGLAILIVISTTSCKKSFFTDANINPNAPKSVSLASLLTPIEVNIAYTQGGDLSRYTTMLTQQTNGYSRQSAAYYTYIFTGQDFDDLWGNFYVSCMNNDKTLMTQADATGSNEYSGIARLLMAYSLQMTVDVWGNVPYSKAFQGLADLHPAYDQGSAVYDVIQGLITDGEADLNNPDPGAFTPSADDIVYGGDASKWLLFAHALQARIDYHMTKIDASKAAAALTEIAASFASNSDNAQFVFGSDQTSSNPWFQFNQQRTDIAFAPFPAFGLPAATLFLEMESSHDPRTGAFYDSTFSEVQGDGESPYYMNANSPVEFITFDELQFMKAQCTLISGGSVSDAQTAFQTAIQANMDKLGVGPADAATYIAAHGTLSSTTADAEAQIGAEQWIALYTNPEAWTVYRLTGSPALTPTAGANGIPRRLLYPNTELTYNNNTDNSAATLFSPKIFWDN